jgi:hypothetical protein
LGAGSNGGAATATSSATATAAGTVAATASAIGGNGGASSSGPGGVGGAANAAATAIGLGTTNATSTADGGNGIGRSLHGAAVARSNSTGTGGNAQADAISAGGLTIVNVQTQAIAPTSGTSHAEARAGTSNPARDASLAAGIQSAVFATATPTLTDVQSFFAGNVYSQPSFNLVDDAFPGNSSDIFGLVTMGAAYSESGSGNRTYTSTATFAIDLSLNFNPAQRLVVALLDRNSQGVGFDSMTFTITREGTMVVNQTFNTLATALAFFDDELLDLGSNGPLNVSGNLDLIFGLSLTTNDAGAGFQFDLAFGNSSFGSAEFDVDGDVDGRDFLTWQRNYGLNPATPPQGDADRNGTVGDPDYAIWKSQFGFTAQGGPFAGAVPEPGALALAALGAALLVTRRRRD